MKLFALLFLVFGSTGFAQNAASTTDGIKTEKVLLIPFEEKMYLSSVDREIAQKTGMTFPEIRSNMRFALMEQLMLQLEPKTPALSLLHIDTGNVAQDLGYIYSSIGYKYQLLEQDETEEEVEKKGIDRLKNGFNKFTKKVKEKVHGEEEKPTYSGLENGQVVTQYDRKERYMNTSIHNPNLLKQLKESYGTDLFVFINQLDIETASSGQYERSNNTFDYKIKVHYTIFTVNGKEKASGAATTFFPSKKTEINGIIKGYFPKVTSNIAKEARKTSETDTSNNSQND